MDDGACLACVCCSHFYVFGGRHFYLRDAGGGGGLCVCVSVCVCVS